MKSHSETKIISNLMKSFLNNTDDFMFVKNVNLEYVAASEAFAINCIGLNSIEDIIGKSDYDLISDSSIAGQYRKNDRELIESGKTMIEFQETIIDFKGKKHSCLVTKFLIKDNNGKPIGILGQYQNIEQQIEIQAKKDTNRKIANALNKIYFASNYVDLRNHSFTILQAIDYSKKMLKNCKTIEEAFDSFINTLVKSEYVDKMKEFCKVDTIAERIKGRTHIDCEYLSKVAAGWCQARFLPVDWDENGNLTHVLFLVSSLDANTAKELETGINSEKNLQAIFDKVPGGIILYQWDGTSLKTLKISKNYYDQYGYTLSNNGSPDFTRLHPDDLKGYREAIYEALTKTHKLDYVYRAWNREQARYVWTKINAVSEEQPDGTSLVYAMYSDITSQIDAEEKLAQSKNILIQSYKQQFQSLLYKNDDALCICNINVTNDTFCNVNANGAIKKCADNSKNLNDLFRLTSMGVSDLEQRNNYLKIFNKQNFIDSFNKNITHIRYAHLYTIETNHTEYVETVVDLIKNPSTNDIEGITYAKSINKKNIDTILLEKALRRDYPMVAVIFVDTGEYYYYSSDTNDYCTHHNDYWGSIQSTIDNVVDQENIQEVKEQLTKENIIKNLNEKNSCSVTFYSSYHNYRARFEVSFSYVCSSHRLIIASVKNITDTTLFEKYKHDSTHDSITDLYNRATFFQSCEESINNYPSKQYVMIHFDIANFHLYNTFFGENEGDKLLCDLGKLIIEFSHSFSLCHYGRIEADVFGIFIETKNDNYSRDIKALYDKAKLLRDNFLIDPIIGVYISKDNSLSIESMFARATTASITDKVNMFGFMTIYNDEMEHTLKDNQTIISEMKGAIEKEQFKVYLQPKYNLRTNEMVGSEALVRWIHPEKGMISPGKFIPLFESNGFIAELDKYMWEKVCKLLKKWKNESQYIMPISVNVSRISMYNHNTVQFLKDLVNKYDIEPKYLELELTETAYMDDPDEMKLQLKELQDYGFHILMDDFGSGYSSLNTLKELPVDVLKLDMRFLTDSAENQRGRLVLASVIRMAKLLGLKIIAEGVEDSSQANYLKDIGCEEVQGFLFARPMPVANYEKIRLNKIDDTKIITQNNLEHLKRILVDDKDASYSLSEIVPVPTGIIEYSNNNAIFLRVNPSLLHEFGLNKNLRAASLIFQEHLSKEDYQLLLDSYADSIKLQKNIDCKLVWNDNEPRTYIVNISYQGEIGNSHILVVTFTNITKFK